MRSHPCWRHAAALVMVMCACGVSVSLQSSGDFLIMYERSELEAILKGASSCGLRVVRTSELSRTMTLARAGAEPICQQLKECLPGVRSCALDGNMKLVDGAWKSAAATAAADASQTLSATQSTTQGAAADASPEPPTPPALESQADTPSTENVCNNNVESGDEVIPYSMGVTQVSELNSQVPLTNANRTIVCILDTGYDSTHEDLPKAQGYSNSAVLPSRWDAPLGTHGTHVAGTIAAKGGNGVGVQGAIPDNANLYIVNVFYNETHSFDSDVLDGLGACMARLDQQQSEGKKVNMVITMSLGGSYLVDDLSNPAVQEQVYNSPSHQLIQELEARGDTLLVAAAGNGQDPQGRQLVAFPAGYDEVIAVAAVDCDLQAADFSFQNQDVEIAAPGVRIWSTTPGNGYGSADGTSMAAPLVTGVLARTWAEFPNCSSSDIRSALRRSAKDVDAAGQDVGAGYGLLQAQALYDKLTALPCAGQNQPTSAPPAPPQEPPPEPPLEQPTPLPPPEPQSPDDASPPPPEPQTPDDASPPPPERQLPDSPSPPPSPDAPTPGPTVPGVTDATPDSPQPPQSPPPPQRLPPPPALDATLPSAPVSTPPAQQGTLSSTVLVASIVAAAAVALGVGIGVGVCCCSGKCKKPEQPEFNHPGPQFIEYRAVHGQSPSFV